MKIGGYLLRCYTKINPQRAKSTPPVNFCSRLVSISPIVKSVGDTAHLLRRIMKSVQGCTLFMASFGIVKTSLPVNTSGIHAATDKCSTYRNGHGCPWFYTVASLRYANSLLNSVHGGTLFNRSPLYFCSRLVSGTTIFKRVLSKIGGYL